jgi:hypothetical protein
VSIEGEVEGIEAHLVSNEGSQFPVVRSSNGFQTTPEKAVMYEEEIHPPLRRRQHRLLASVYRSPESPHLGGSFNLQTVEGIPIIWMCAGSKGLVQKTEDMF